MRSGLFTSQRRLVPNWGLAMAGVMLATGLVAMTPLTVAASSTPYNTNLVKNSKAESGVTHWDTFPDGSFGTVKYGVSGLGYPSTYTASQMGGGKHFFWAGPYDSVYSGCGDAHQQILLTGIGSSIDSGNVKVKLSGYAGTNGAASLNAHLDVYFRNAQNHSVASNGITKVASSTNEQYKHIKASKVLSKHTRILDVHLWADGDDISSTNCQAFWDNISVSLVSA